jgi:hypothetical protein
MNINIFIKLFFSILFFLFASALLAGEKENNFLSIKSSLKNLDFRSIYHHKTKEDYGSEKEPTFFHTKKENKSYHIDYLFLKGMEAKSIDIGLYSDWIELSDHMPLVCEI